MKMKISDVIRKVNDKEMAKIIGATVAQHIDGISTSKAVQLDYPNTLQVLQQEIEVDYEQTNADRIRAMSDEELAAFLDIVEQDGIQSQYNGVPCDCCCEKTECANCWKAWLQSELEE